MRTAMLLAALCAACGSPAPRTGEPAGGRKPRSDEAAAARRQADEFTDVRPVPEPSAADLSEFDRIWEYYRNGDARWPLERDRFVRRGDAAGYLLAAHLLRHYMRVNQMRERAGRELVRVKNEIVDVGEPCAPSLVDMMILDRIPLRDGKAFLTDDLTRQDCADMLERMGPQAAPSLLRALGRKDLGPKQRRLIALSLGGTNDRRAYEPLVRLLESDPSWQVRADAATALAKLGDRRAIEPLGEAVRTDPDRTVVRRAGKARLELLQGRSR